MGGGENETCDIFPTKASTHGSANDATKIASQKLSRQRAVSTSNNQQAGILGKRGNGRDSIGGEVLGAPAKKNMKRTYPDCRANGLDEDGNGRAFDLLRRGKKRRRCMALGADEIGFLCGRYGGGLWGRMRARESGQLDDGQGFLDKTSTKRWFKNMKKMESLDTYDPCLFSDNMMMPWLRKRAKVVEIVSHENLIFALTHTGVCAAFDRNLGKRICFINVTGDEVIRSLFLNKMNASLITVSVFRDDGFSSLKCRSIPLEGIQQGKVDESCSLFESETLRWPGFVEFDDVNSKILTFSVDNKTYKVWTLASYKHLYTINDDRIQEIKISPGAMLLIQTRSESYVPLRIVDIETGTVLKSFNHLLHRNRKIDFVEQFNEKLLVKQENENLQIVDVRTADIVSVPKSQFLTPSAFIFLYGNQLFLTFRQRQVSVWNFKGQLVTNFEDHTLWHTDPNTNSIYITSNQDLIMSFCKQEGNRYGSINVSWINNGKSLAKISCEPDDDAGSRSSPGHGRGSFFHSTLLSHSPPDDVTSLYYNEVRNEIYAGTRSGMIHIWSN